MFRPDAREYLDLTFLRRPAQLIKLAATVLLSTTLIGLSPVSAQNKEEADVFYGVQVVYKGTVDAKVSVTDRFQRHKVLLSTTMSPGQTITVKARARVARQTQHTYFRRFTDLRWSVNSPKHDENGVPLKPGDTTSKIMRWCGDYITHLDNMPIVVGFKGSGHGRAC